MPRTLIVMAVLAQASVEDCGNGNACPSGQTCTSRASGAGCRFGCAPTLDAVICNDARYSCPANYTCEFVSATCRNGGKAAPLLTNGNAAPASPMPLGVGSANGSLCEIFKPDLPASCVCADALLGASIACRVGVLLEDAFGLKADILPCDHVAHVDLQITESKHSINYTIAGVAMGETKHVPIPGLTIGIPKIGDASVDATVTLEGSLSEFTVKVGVDACAVVAGESICGSDLTRYLPFWVFHGTYHIEGICGRKTASMLVV